ncbi:MAG: outer membrane protein assembly factor BamD [Candidatus Liberibacter ctenarytainae]|uniref:Outer membrane protein assembly factor BamD n=1 Tax=Candidatus Liberibacter ctenarytainae TaxID=2020335 RepID=A0A937ASB7_9HYPH|nr:outer membrane protein assembly factor BamD [Candidatus Liberibacter ctenarytainae]
MYRFALTLFIVVMVFPMMGCRHQKYESISDIGISSQSPELTYAEGVKYLQKGLFLQSYKKFQEIVHSSPFSKEARKALFMSAFVKYRNGQYEEAALIGTDYITKYGGSEDIDYMYYLSGICYFEMIRNVSHSQTPARNMVAYMENLVVNYPHSSYAKSAQSYIRIGRNQLAAREMHIGRYYLTQEEYISAITRFQGVVRHYSDTEQAEEALARIIEAYFKVGLIGESREILSLLQKKYPQGYWCQYAKKLIQYYDRS